MWSYKVLVISLALIYLSPTEAHSLYRNFYRRSTALEPGLSDVVQPSNQLSVNLKQDDQLTQNIQLIDQQRSGIDPSYQLGSNVEKNNQFTGALQPNDQVAIKMRPSYQIVSEVQKSDLLTDNLKPKDRLSLNLMQGDQLLHHIQPSDQLAIEIRPTYQPLSGVQKSDQMVDNLRQNKEVLVGEERKYEIVSIPQQIEQVKQSGEIPSNVDEQLSRQLQDDVTSKKIIQRKYLKSLYPRIIAQNVDKTSPYGTLVFDPSQQYTSLYSAPNIHSHISRNPHDSKNNIQSVFRPNSLPQYPPTYQVPITAYIPQNLLQHQGTGVMTFVGTQHHHHPKPLVNSPSHLLPHQGTMTFIDSQQYQNPKPSVDPSSHLWQHQGTDVMPFVGNQQYYLPKPMVDSSSQPQNMYNQLGHHLNSLHTYMI